MTTPQGRAPASGRGSGMVPIGRFRGVPVYFAPSWLIIAAFLTVYYAPVVADLVPGTSGSTHYATAFAYAVLFALCVLAHELGHTAVSLALGNPVRRVVIFLLGGVSEITKEPGRPRDEFLVAAAGPAVSLALAGVSGIGYALTSHATVARALAVLLLWSNLVVAVFNLLPGLPLDGGRLLRAAVWAVAKTRTRGTQVAAWAGRSLAVLIAIGGLMLDQHYGLISGLITVAMAAYLWVGAGQSLRVGAMLDRVPNITLQQLLRPGLLVPSDLSVAEALRRAWSGSARGLVVVDGADRPSGIVDETLIGSVPEPQRPWTPVASVARPLEPGLILHLGLTGDALLTAVRATPAHEYLVVDDAGKPAGILSVVDLAARLQAQP